MKKIIAGVLIFVLVAVTVLFALGKVRIYTYAGVLLGTFLYAKFIQPRLT